MRLSLLAAAAFVAAQPQAASAAPAPRTDNAAAVRSVLHSYMDAVEKLDPKGTEHLFSTNSMIFEGGGSEGTYANYLAHHLTPELGEFKSFKFGNYKVNVRFKGPVALATETYTYRIETRKGEVADRLGVATSVLRKENSRWKIVVMHNSSRKPSAS
jgi:uncharacterized protein (TIGR02246 family)